MNVLHWHIVDEQSFPCGSDKYPQLAEKGAYSHDAIYSTKDMKDIVKYAYDRGVRVIPEWDIPGHGSWGHGMPDVMGCDIVLDPTQNRTYEFLNSFFEEMMGIFRDEYVHLGGDEVDYTCWDANPKIASWLKKNHMNSSELYVPITGLSNDTCMRRTTHKRPAPHASTQTTILLATRNRGRSSSIVEGQDDHDLGER